MKKTLLAVALAMACGAAAAQTANADANAGANAGAASQSGSVAVVNLPTNPDHIWTYGNQTVTSNGTQTVNTTGTSTVKQELSGTQTIKNVPNIGMSGPASGPCTGPSGGVTVAVPGAGVGINGASTESDCQLRELARIAAMLGDRDMASRALMATDAWDRVTKKEAESKPAPKAATGAGIAPLASNADLCTQARAKDDKPLQMRVCR